MIKRVCVYCGSRFGDKQEYREAATALGKRLADSNIELVYGGGNVGLMGTIANAVLENGGRVIGVIPKHLADLEVAHPDLTELKIVDSMHERKALLEELSDAFIALPGGFGTLDEIFEILTWAQLQLHSKPCGFLNVEGFYDQLFSFLKHVSRERFISDTCLSLFCMEESIEILLEKLNSYETPKIDKAKVAIEEAVKSNRTPKR